MRHMSANRAHRQVRSVPTFVLAVSSAGAVGTYIYTPTSVGEIVRPIDGDLPPQGRQHLHTKPCRRSAEQSHQHRLVYNWVPEGSLAGFCLGAFLGSGRPRGPGKAFQNVGGEAPTFLKAFPGPRGRPNFKNAPPKNNRPDCLQVPRFPRCLLL